MSAIQESIRLEVPTRAAYDQWTQFETFPAFMEGVEEVRHEDDARLHWKAEIGGVRREWDAIIVEQEPDRVIAWQSTDGSRNDGRVEFRSFGDEGCEVTLRMDFEPDGFVEKAGDVLGVVRRRVQGDLERFKDFIESRGGRETGAWRGSIDRGRVTG